MVHGLVAMSSEIFYDNRLVPGMGTALDDPKRKHARRLVSKSKSRCHFAV